MEALLIFAVITAIALVAAVVENFGETSDQSELIN